MEFVAVFAPFVVKELANRARSFLGGQHELRSDVKDKLKTLSKFLLKLQCVVEVTEGKTNESQFMVQWLKEFKKLVYEVEDLLDTFAYRELERKSSSTIKRGLRKVSNVVRHKPGELSDLSSYIKKLERLDADVRDLVDIIKLNGKSKKLSLNCELPTGTPKKNKQSFVGREEEKEAIINFLLNTESYGTANVPILPILGAGGIGKTALAQEVYNDEKVKRHFSLRMWVCVSNNFNVGRLIREMLDHLHCHDDHIDVEDLDELQEILKKKLSLEKLLLVLDNVWKETLRKVCDMLEDCAPLCHRNEGSKILLTSRLERAAEWMKIKHPIKLKGLPEHDYQSFFSKCAFGDADPDRHQRLAEIGQEIAFKLKGSPLAAMTVGELLKDKLKEDHWESILNSDIWEQEQGHHDIMPALTLSYLHLPCHLKQCFSYLSVTPKVWELFYNKVIGMWMAHGMYYHHDREKRIEDIVKGYFDALISKSFFQSTMKEDVYSLHDLLHDLAENTYKSCSLRIEHDEVKEIPSTVQHLSISTNTLVGLQKNASVLKNLRTLLFLHTYSVNFDDANLHDVLKQLRSVRVLSLSYCRMEKLPGNLSDLIHLRYLDLSQSGIKELSDGVTKLYHLQILNLSQLEFDQVPAKMNRLINLRSLICSAGVFSKVRGIAKMNQLQELMCPFSVQNDPEFDIGQLGDLKELRGCLCIRNLENVDSKKQAGEARLCEKDKLVELVLHWEYVEWDTKLEVENEILDGLKPHGELKKLCIDGYKGNISPSWMVCNYGLDNLVSLKLIDCKAWENLPPLGQLLQLQVLEVSGMHAIKEVGCGFHGSSSVKGFPSLRELIFDRLPEWKMWSADDIEVDLFPRLQNLRISECPKLTTIPPLPATLQRLQLFNLGLIEFPKLLARTSSSSLSSSLAILTIKGCQQLQYPSKWLIEQHECLRNLKELTVFPCNKLDGSLVKNSNKFSGLKKLCLVHQSSMEEENCPSLNTKKYENL
ncbi:disease resistance protein RGA2-like [Typha latifolia]|uniref:disease resistance protein RGA2-like n=1 Tax=Typha latifolia TaxID=4733 RepID=UPI003C2B158E